jgi:Polysaccharide deacetylase
MSSIILSFDVEEFDIPLEYNKNINLAEQMEVGKRGLDAIIPIWEKYKTPTTLFTTALFAQQFSDIIKSLSDTHEIASHTFYWENRYRLTYATYAYCSNGGCKSSRLLVRLLYKPNIFTW